MQTNTNGKRINCQKGNCTQLQSLARKNSVLKVFLLVWISPIVLWNAYDYSSQVLQCEEDTNLIRLQVYEQLSGGGEVPLNSMGFISEQTQACTRQVISLQVWRLWNLVY